jgi:hypothetical protein
MPYDLISNFDSVLMVFSCDGVPPQGRDIKRSGKDHQFAPLIGEMPVFTVDQDLWRHFSSERNEQHSDCAPSYSKISRIIDEALRNNLYCVVALTSMKHITPLGATGSDLPLVSWTSLMADKSCNEFVHMGCDVIDKWTGISALVNIGYNAQDLEILSGFAFKTNSYGLFQSSDEADAFAKIADSVAPEHSPFISVASVVRMPRSAIEN